jgi:hypothetical protein
MEIVSIFAPNLYAFHYKDESDNEFTRLMELWMDVGYLKAFAKVNGITDSNRFVTEILSNAEEIDDFLYNLDADLESFSRYFEPLQTSEYTKVLSFQKGKIKRNRLRLYAIKIDNNCFVITGGAIKMSQTMQENPFTAIELKKLNEARTFLQSRGVFDDDSFYEIIL